MARSSQTVDDRTPISGSRIDVAARIGWLLRTHRTVGGYSLREMSAALRDHGFRLSPASLSRIESEGQLSPAALDGYCAVLGLPRGSLRTPAETIFEAFRAGPSLTGPTTPLSLERFSAAYDAVTSDSPTAGDWLEFAQHHLAPSGFGLPVRLMDRAVERLAAEAGRSVTPARVIRRLALSVLRQSPYAEVVADVAARVVDDPDFQGSWDVLEVLSVRPSGELLDWAAGLLSRESTYTVVGATFLLQSMLLKAGLTLDDWRRVVEPLRRAWAASDDDAQRRAALTQLGCALPPPLQKELPEVCTGERSRQAAPRTWSRDRGNPHYVYAESLAEDACRRLGQGGEPLLARLLFESFFDPRGVRMATATTLVLASPYAAEVVRRILERRDDAPDHASWTAALRVAAFCHAEGDVPGLDRLLAVEDQAELSHALTLASRQDRPLADAVVERGLAGDELVVRRTLYCLGMQADDRRLKEIESDLRRPAWVRGGARWWRAEGGRLVL